MILVLFNKDEITISQEEANMIDTMIESGVKWLKIGEFSISVGAIAFIKPGGEKNTIKPDHQLSQPDYRGTYSPAKEKLRSMWSVDK